MAVSARKKMETVAKPKKEKGIKVSIVMKARGVVMAIGSSKRESVREMYDRLLKLNYGLKAKHKGKNWIGGANGVWRHEEIAYVQTIYNTYVDLGIIKGERIRVDGVYGDKTKAAIKKLQKLVGAKVDGYFGAETRSKLIAYVSKNKERLQDLYSGKKVKAEGRSRTVAKKVKLNVERKKAVKKKKRRPTAPI